MTRWLNELPVYLSDLRQITHNFFPSSFPPANHIVMDEKMKPKMIITFLAVPQYQVVLLWGWELLKKHVSQLE